MAPLHARGKVGSSQSNLNLAPFPMSYIISSKDQADFNQKQNTGEGGNFQVGGDAIVGEQPHTAHPPELNREKQPHSSTNNRSGSTGRFRVSGTKRFNTYNSGRKMVAAISSEQQHMAAEEQPASSKAAGAL